MFYRTQSDFFKNKKPYNFGTGGAVEEEVDEM